MCCWCTGREGRYPNGIVQTVGECSFAVAVQEESSLGGMAVGRSVKECMAEHKERIRSTQGMIWRRKE